MTHRFKCQLQFFSYLTDLIRSNNLISKSIYDSSLIRTIRYLKNDNDVTLLFSCPIIQTILDHERPPIVYLSPNIDYVNTSRLFRLVYKI